MSNQTFTEIEDHLRATQQEKMAVAEHVRQLYKSGVPLYTKKAIGELAEQLEEVKANGSAKVTLARLDGKTQTVGILHKVLTEESWVTFNPPSAVSSGHSSYAWDWVGEQQDAGHTQIGINPHVEYHSLGSLIDPEGPYDPDLPLGVVYDTAFRDATTGALLTFPLSASVPCDELWSFFQRQRDKWETSEGCKRLRELLATGQVPPVRKIVAFACGPMFCYDEFRSHVAFQHAIIMTLRDVFSQETQCFAQDPYYTEEDKKILNGEGIYAVDDPHGFLEVDDESAIISVGADVPIRNIVLDLAKPALLITNEVESERFQKQTLDNRVNDADPITPRVQDILRDQYYKIPFPHTDDGYASTKSRDGREDKLAIYIRKL
ncbi:hypothetical protein OQA88_9349 [Cercophora sp. LCS_1]